MKKSFSLWTSFIAVCLCVCAIAIGVYAATASNLTMSGRIAFTAHGVDITISGTLSGFVSQEYVDAPKDGKTETKTFDTIELHNNSKSIDIGEVYFTDLVGETVPNIVLALNITNTSKFKVLASVDTMALSNTNISATVDGKTTKTFVIDEVSGQQQIVITFALRDSESDALLDFTNQKLINFVKYVEGGGYVDERLYDSIISAYAPDNMFNESLLKRGYAVSTSANKYEVAETHSAYEEIAVVPNGKYHIKSQNGTTSFRTLYVKNDGTYEFQAKTISNNLSEITMPEGCIGFKISGVTEMAEGLYMVPVPTTTVAFIGDSITELPYGWQKQVKDYYYWNSSNAAIGGCTIASYGNTGTPSKTRDPIVERYATALNADADICMVAAGTNDWWYQWCDIGTDQDTQTTTFKGALHTLCKGLKEMYSDKPIVFLTPIKRGEDPNKQNAFNRTLEDYVNAIIDVCAQYDIHVIDLYRICPLDPSISEHQEQFFDGNLNVNEGYTFWYDDTTHPNVYGARVQARFVIDELNDILKNYNLK